MPYKDVQARRKAKRERYRREKESILRKEREYRAANPAAYRNTKLKHRYGLTHEMYQAMFNAQGGMCALCRERPAADVDHCHKTMRVRGLLCRSCNVGLGLFQDSADRLLDAIAYLKRMGDN